MADYGGHRAGQAFSGALNWVPPPCVSSSWLPSASWSSHLLSFLPSWEMGSSPALGPPLLSWQRHTAGSAASGTGSAVSCPLGFGFFSLPSSCASRSPERQPPDSSQLPFGWILRLLQCFLRALQAPFLESPPWPPSAALTEVWSPGPVYLPWGPHRAGLLPSSSLPPAEARRVSVSGAASELHSHCEGLGSCAANSRWAGLSGQLQCHSAMRLHVGKQ